MKRFVLGIACCLVHCKPASKSGGPSTPAGAIPVEASSPSVMQSDADADAGTQKQPEVPLPGTAPEKAETDKKEAEPAPTPTTAPQQNSVPKPTHKVAVTCTGEARFDFTFNGTTATINLGQGPFANGSRTLLTVSCPKMLSALNGKSFPTAATLSKPEGGPKIQASCGVTSLTIKASEGDPGGTSASVAKTADLESVEVCLQIRNVINGLNL